MPVSPAPGNIYSDGTLRVFVECPCYGKGVPPKPDDKRHSRADSCSGSNFSQGSRHLLEASGYLVTSAEASTWLSLPQHPSSTLLCNARDSLMQRGEHETQWLHPTMEFVAVPCLPGSARASHLPLQPWSGCCVPSYPCSARHLRGAAQKHTHSTSLGDCKCPPHPIPRRERSP